MHEDSGASRPLPDLVGGRYRIVSRLGVGGMGVVYKAVDTQLNRAVAVKALEDRRRLLGGSERRLRGEALAAASLDHPYICKVYELVETDTETFIVMEYVEGETLASMLKRGPLPLAQALQLGREVAEGLADAHAHGLVHRDVKPSNVMVTPHGHVKLLDFGVAGADVTSLPMDETRTLSPHPTVHGGTPQYMAPEQAAGQPVTARADLFSLGVLLYESLTGQLPFSGTTTFDYVRHVLQSAPRRLDRIAPNTPAALVDLIERCLEKSPATRPESAQAVVDALRRLSDALASPHASLQTAKQARSGRRWRVAALLILMVAAIAVIINALWPTGSDTTRSRTRRPFVTSSAQEFGSRISPDGQWVSFISTAGDDTRVMLQQVGGGEPRPLTLGPGTPTTQGWSPDGRQIACVMQVNDEWLLQIYPAFFGGVPARTVTLGDSLTRLKLLRWIDRSIYLQTQSPRGLALQRVDLDAGATATMTDLSGAWTLPGTLRDVDVSPDGRSLALALSVGGQGDLWTAALNGSSLRALTSDPYFDRLPIWNGRGDRIIFQSNRGGQADLWEIDPRTLAMTQLTSGEMESVPESVSADDAVMTYQQLSHDARLWSWGPRVGDDVQLTQDGLSDYSSALAGDGRTLAFQRSLPTPSRGYTILDARLVVAPFDGRAIGADLRPIDSGFAPALSADGRWLASLQPAPQGAKPRLLVRDLMRGTTVTLSESSAAPIFSILPVDWASRTMAWSPVEATLYFIDHTDVPTLRRHHAGTNTPVADVARSTDSETLLRDPYLSPDGRQLAYLSASRSETAVHAIDLTTNTARLLARLPVALTGTYGRGWIGDDFVVVRVTTMHQNLSADLEVLLIGRTGAPRVAGLITNAFNGTTRLHASKRSIYVTRVENGIHNLHEFAIATGRTTALTRNSLPGVTFSGFQPAGADRVIGSREERRQDLWLIETTAPPRPGNSAGR